MPIVYQLTLDDSSIATHWNPIHRAELRLITQSKCQHDKWEAQWSLGQMNDTIASGLFQPLTVLNSLTQLQFTMCASAFNQYVEASHRKLGHHSLK